MTICAFAAVALIAAAPVSAGSLPRVMSLNVCTDQLLLVLAEPEQIVSLSSLADDHALSFHHKEAAAFPKNRGLAEEVFLAKPDVIVTGTFSLHNTTALLRHLGLPVHEFDFAQTLDTIPGDIRRMGKAIGQEARGEAMADRFEQDLAALALPADAERPGLILYDQNGVVVGSGTLGDTVARAAGWRNLAADWGIVGMAPLSLEVLVQAEPDIVLVNRPYDENAPSLADQAALHPAIAALGERRRIDPTPQGSSSCGGPFTLEAVKALRALRDEVLAHKDRPSG